MHNSSRSVHVVSDIINFKVTKENGLTFKVIPLKMMHYPDLFPTRHKCQTYVAHSKTAIKIWGHCACLCHAFP